MPPTVLDRQDLPFVMAHRGFDLDGLENSMRAFEAAVRIGVTFLETDVRATADGVLLAFHDRRLDRVTDRSGEVSRLPWREVRRARIGGQEPIPRLEELLAAFPDVAVNIDLKAPGSVRPFVAAVRRAAAADRIVVASFSDRRRAAAVRALSTTGPVAWSPGSGGMVRVLAALRRAERLRASGGDSRRTYRADVEAALGGAACLQVPWRLGRLRLVTTHLVDAVHAAGAQVHVWTVDDPAVMGELLGQGVDALITNRSDLALDLVRRRS